VSEDWSQYPFDDVQCDFKVLLRRWWRQHPNGSYALFVRSGLKAIEFEKGKPAIAVSSLDKLPSVIDTLITAIRNGELD